MVGGVQTLALSSGREVRLDSLRQWYVYAGLLDGVPSREINDRIVANIVAEARTKIDHEPYLVPPKQTPLPAPPNRTDPERVRLPSIACVAHLFSYRPASDPKMDCSELIVIWFQEHYAFPIAEEAERALKAIDWARLARDGLY